MSSLPQPEPDQEPASLPVEWLDLVTAAAAAEGDSLPALQGEAVTAEDARAALERARGHVRALGALSLVPAPATLDGMVVGSLHAGARQDRAASYLRSLPSLPAPALLDEAVEAIVAGEAPELGPAPAVLDRLVEERLGDPEASMTRSMTGRLDRQSAPGELEGRVRAQLSSELETAGTGRRMLAAIGAAVLAVLLVVTANQLLDRGAAGEGPVTPAAGVSLKIVHVTADELSSTDRALLQALGGPL